MSARIVSLGARYGADRRENAWYRDHQPAVLQAEAEQRLARVFTSRGGDAASRPFDARMQRYLDDPFRGAVVRYKLGPDETVSSLELAAARDALDAAGLDGRDVDVILVASWLPVDFVAPGNAVYLARALGTTAPAINLETACSSGLAGLEIAEGLLAVGRYRRALLVLSNTLSRQADDANTLGWISSDTAAAVVLEACADGDVKGSAMENTAETAGVFVHRLDVDAGAPRVRMELGPVDGRALRAHGSPERVRRLCDRALARAGVGLDRVRLIGCSTPLAWFGDVCREALEVDDERLVDLFPRVGNAGLPFPALHLHHAVAEGRLDRGDLALLFTIGSTSSAGAMVVRAGDWATGPHPGSAS